MSCNRDKPHLLVLPEDDANRQIANGFVLHAAVQERFAQVLPVKGGWIKTKNAFLKEYAGYVRKNPSCIFVLLIDLDGQAERAADVQAEIPDDLKDRVFVLSTLSEPEALRSDLKGKPFEKIGQTLAEECVDSNHQLWRHPLLQHNRTELDRLRPPLKSFLFRTLSAKQEI